MSKTLQEVEAAEKEVLKSLPHRQGDYNLSSRSKKRIKKVNPKVTSRNVISQNEKKDDMNSYQPEKKIKKIKIISDYPWETPGGNLLRHVLHVLVGDHGSVRNREGKNFPLKLTRLLRVKLIDLKVSHLTRYKLGLVRLAAFALRNGIKVNTDIPRDRQLLEAYTYYLIRSTHFPLLELTTLPGTTALKRR